MHPRLSLSFCALIIFLNQSFAMESHEPPGQLLDLLPELKSYAPLQKKLELEQSDNQEKFLPEAYKLMSATHRDLYTLKQIVESFSALAGTKKAHDTALLTRQIDFICEQIRNRLKEMHKLSQNIPQGKAAEIRICLNLHEGLQSQYVELRRKYLKIGDGLSTQQLDRAYSANLFVAARHEQILKLEQSLNEVHQLFMDLSFLIDEQGEVINRISFRVSNAKDDVIAAEEELVVAYKIKKKKGLRARLLNR